MRIIKNMLDSKIDASQKGAAGGVAELDANGKVPVAQLPSVAAGARIFAETTDTWNQSEDVPEERDILVYLDKATVTVDGQEVGIPGIKIGNGTSLPRNLPFVDAATIDGIGLNDIVAKRVGHRLTFGAGGEFVFDGSADVTVPVYTGEYTPGNENSGVDAGYQEDEFSDD